MTKKISLDDTLYYFHSADLGLVTYLFHKQHDLIDIDKSERKALFTLKRRKDTDQYIQNYWNFQTSVDAQSYFNSLKVIKNRLYGA